MKLSDAYFRCCITASIVLFVPATLLAQQDRIAGPIEHSRTVVLKGNVNPRAQPQFDRGPVDSALKLDLVTLALKATPDQQADLEQLLNEQQDRTSPNYHHWLTPEQYAERFGLSPGDIGKVRLWLESQGFAVTYVARGRNRMTFSGTAAQLGGAFHIEIHRYAVDGEMHFANAAEPSIPAALEPVVAGFLNLDDFHLKPPLAPFKSGSGRNPSTPKLTANGNHALAPDDIATIYDITRLYKAGVDGSGQRVVVAGQSDINQADITDFYGAFGVPVYVPKVVLEPGSADPGITAAQGEADLDVEWVGAVARNAQITYVNSTSVLDSVAYAISENLAPVISYSFGGCEATFSHVDLSNARSNAQQANVQGISLIVASGDSGAAECDAPFVSPEATQGLAVSFPADIPEVTAVGGTEFNEGGGVYWSNTNSPTGESALSYIPEIAWNESPPLLPPSGFPSALAASGGGFSTFYPQPSWQAGPGLVLTNFRAVPDVALSAAGHDPYSIFTGGQPGLDRGTSAATPVFAGMIVLLNQYEGSSGQGNINPNLYRLAQTNIFHDITTGNNIVQCVVGSPNCTTGSFGYYAGIGYDPVTGLGSVDAYNLVTEWNAATPVSHVVASSNPDPVYQQAPDSNGFSWAFTLTLSETAGVGTSFTGFTVNGEDHSSEIESLFGTSTIAKNGAISAPLGYTTLTVPTTIVFGFSGTDAGGRQWTQQLSVPFNGMQTSPAGPAVSAVVSASAFGGFPSVAPGSWVEIYGSNLAPDTRGWTGSDFRGNNAPTSLDGVSVSIGGQAAFVDYISPNQVNAQLPSNIATGDVLQLTLTNGTTTSAPVNLTVNATEPGLLAPASFKVGANQYVVAQLPDGTYVLPTGAIAGINSRPAQPGETIVIYGVGFGSVTPNIPAGQIVTESNQLSASFEISFGQTPAPLPLLYFGLAPNLVGVYQFNVVVPAVANNDLVPLTFSLGGVPGTQTLFTAVQQ
jgi:uncharacterized protein (TIGR03437 family)